jgi:hypothetical protein
MISNTGIQRARSGLLRSSPCAQAKWGGCAISLETGLFGDWPDGYHATYQTRTLGDGVWTSPRSFAHVRVFLIAKLCELLLFLLPGLAPHPRILPPPIKGCRVPNFCFASSSFSVHNNRPFSRLDCKSDCHAVGERRRIQKHARTKRRQEQRRRAVGGSEPSAR